MVLLCPPMPDEPRRLQMRLLLQCRLRVAEARHLTGWLKSPPLPNESSLLTVGSLQASWHIQGQGSLPFLL